MKNEAMIELTKKFQDQEAFPMMKGTDRHLDYFVVARKPAVNCQLGIKLMVGLAQTPDGSQGIVIAFRMRSAPIPPASNVVELDGEKPEPVEQGDPGEAWDFPWEVNSYGGGEPRARLHRAIALARGVNEAQFVAQDLDHMRFFGKVMAFLQSHVPVEDFTVTQQDLADYVKVSLYEPLLMFQAKSGDPAVQLEQLEHTWATKVKNHEEAQANYDTVKAQLQEAIKAKAAGGEPEYVAKEPLVDSLVGFDELAQAVNTTGSMKTAKPKLQVVGGTEHEGSAALLGGDEGEADGDGGDGEED